MKRWKKYSTGLAVLAGLTPRLWAQLPAVPAANGAAAVPAAAAAAPPPATLWSFLGLTCDQKKACKDKLCQTPIGQLLNNSMRPLGALSGGLLGPCCPEVNPADLAKADDPSSAVGAAAEIKASEAAAKARRAAIRYLGTVDCNWWPEAQDALIAGLRTDTNECVRYEAALALNRGCCCTKRTIAALTDSVKGEKRLGPAENSERVKAAATIALNHCLACVPQETQEKPPESPQKPPETPAGKPPAELPKNMTDARAPSKIRLAAYIREIENTPMEQVVQQARQALGEQRSKPIASVEQSDNQVSLQTASRSDHSLYSILANARRGRQAVAKEQPQELTALTTPAAVVSDSPVTVTPQPLPSRAPQPAPATTPSTTLTAAPAATPTTRPASTSTAAPAATPMIPPSTSTAAPAATSRIAPAAYSPSAPSKAKHSTAAAPTAPQESGSSRIQEWVSLLNTSTYPELREYAAANLAAFDWRANPQIVEALLGSARKDATVTVRVACIRSVAKMNANSPAVQQTLRDLSGDVNATIRDAAYLALSSLRTGQSN